MKYDSFLVLIVLLLLSGKINGQALGDSLITISEEVSLVKITDKVYVHRSQLDIPNYGKFGCNGMLFINNGEATVVDTPADIPQTELLLAWLEKQHVQVTSVIVNHFHDGCLAGLPSFHSRNIPSFSNVLTQKLAIEDSLVAPLHTFSDSLTIMTGGQDIITKFPGQAHTVDNTVTYVPSEKVLFGGCMMKSLKFGEGNLEDANTQDWSETIANVRALFPFALHVIPGHGRHGGQELLDHTIKMFGEY